MNNSEVPSRAVGRFSARRTPRACHGACDHLRPGRLRASHAVCLRYFTLEPVSCARKEETNNERGSTTGRVLVESSVMRGDISDTQAVFFGFYVTSRYSIPRLSPQNSNRSEVTANNGAAENRSGRLRAVTARAFCERSGSYIWASAVRSTVGHAPRHAPPSLSLGSLGVATL